MTNRNHSLRLTIHLPALVALAMFTTGFTFISNPPAKLPATIENPDVSFLWDGKAPALDEKDSFRDGVFADQSDEQVMEALIAEAMDSWNNVQGSYLRLSATTATEAREPNPDDQINVIVISETHNLNSAAFAAHTIERSHERHAEIVDCDITVGTKKVSVEFMLYALTHELGHCLGLGHAHDKYQSLMGYSRTPGSAKLSPDDKAGIIYLYGDPAYGDQQVKELIGRQCGIIGAKGGESAAIVLALPLLFFAYRRRSQD